MITEESGVICFVHRDGATNQGIQAATRRKKRQENIFSTSKSPTVTTLTLVSEPDFRPLNSRTRREKKYGLPR